MSDSLAFFISFTAYGSRLAGEDRGSVDRDHNGFGTPLLAADPGRAAAYRLAMTYPPFVLDAATRDLVRDALVAVARKKGWRLWAAHVRTNHAHIVVSAGPGAVIERVMNDLKAAASFRLNKAFPADKGRPYWTRHGSTRYIWDEAGLLEVVNYALHQQGEPMAVYADANDLQSRARSEALRTE